LPEEMTMVEQRREVVTEEYDDPTVERRVVESPRTTEQSRVVDEPAPTYVRRQDPVGNSIAAGSLIQTVVWAVVVLVLLIVGILVLIHYNII